MDTLMQTVTAEEKGDDGTTYYVSSINGEDSNDGTLKNEPFKSLQKINDIELQPGDQVLLEAGSVFEDEYLHIKGSGAEGEPIVIDRYGQGDAPQIQTNGEGIWYQDYGIELDNPGHKNKGDVSSSILLYDVEYIEINNLDISNYTDMSEEAYSELDRMDRTGIAAVAQNEGTINHIYLNNLNIHDVTGNVYNKHMNNGGIYFTVFNPEDEKETGISRYNDVKIENNKVENVNRWGIAVGYTAYHGEFSGKGEIPDELIDKYGSSNVTIRNNNVIDPGGDAITTMYLDRPLVEYNVSEGAAKDINDNVYSETGFGEVAAAIWPWKSKNAIFQYNEAFGTHASNGENNDGQAWDADYGDGTIYQYNYSHDNEGGTYMACCGANPQESVNNVFRYNISENDGESGILSLPGNPDAEIYNNIFYVKEGVDFIRDNMRGGTANVENNIIYYAGDEKEEDWAADSNVTYSHNVYYNYANTPDSDENAITEKPQFVDPGSGPKAATGKDPREAQITHDREAFNGYQLEDDSPAINKGKYKDDNVEVDFFDNALNGIPDIGVFESDEVTLDVYSDVYNIEDEGIRGVEQDTKVKDFLANLVYAPALTVEVLNENGDTLDEHDIVEANAEVQFSYDEEVRTYNIEQKNIQEDSYNWVDDFVEGQQGDIWYAQEKTDDGYHHLETFSDQYPVWEGQNWASVGTDDHGDNGLIAASIGKPSTYAMAFKAPKSGNVELSFAGEKVSLQKPDAEPSEEGELHLNFTLNGTQIGETNDQGDNVTLSNAAGSSQNVNSITLDVDEGDYIRAELSSNGETDPTGVYITPSVTYSPSSTVSDLKKLVDQYEKTDDITDNEAVHDLQLHLTAVKHFVDQNKSDKSIKHLNGFKTLLEHQKNNENITTKAYEDLIAKTDKVIDTQN